MEKIKNAIKAAYQWLSLEGGMLHFLVCYAIVLTLTPIIGVWWTLLATAIIALGKEAVDFFIQKDNDKPQVIHDLICDGAGVVCAYCTMLLWLIRIL